MAIRIQGNVVIDDSRQGTLQSLEITGTGALKLPAGTSSQRPGSPVAGQLRFNTETNTVEGFNGTEWGAIAGGGTGGTGTDSFSRTIALVGL